MWENDQMKLEFAQEGLDLFAATNPEVLLELLRDKVRHVIEEVRANIKAYGRRRERARHFAPPCPLPESIQGRERAKVTTTSDDHPMRFSHELCSDPAFTEVLLEQSGVRLGRLLAKYGLEANALLEIKRIVKEDFEGEACITVIVEVELLTAKSSIPS